MLKSPRATRKSIREFLVNMGIPEVTKKHDFTKNNTWNQRGFRFEQQRKNSPKVVVVLIIEYALHSDYWVSSAVWLTNVRRAVTEFLEKNEYNYEFNYNIITILVKGDVIV